MLSESGASESYHSPLLGLNPCFNGICSQRMLQSTVKFQLISVLILVLMEYALRALHKGCQMARLLSVLILVLMEYALRVHDFMFLS